MKEKGMGQVKEDKDRCQYDGLADLAREWLTLAGMEKDRKEGGV